MKQKTQTMIDIMIQIMSRHLPIIHCWIAHMEFVSEQRLGTHLGKTEISKEEVDTAMTMPGGDTWGKKVVTGQVTDDTELAVSLAYGLVDCIGKLPDTTRLKSDKDTDDENDKKVYKLKTIVRFTSLLWVILMRCLKRNKMCNIVQGASNTLQFLRNSYQCNVGAV
eukprot:914579_1